MKYSICGNTLLQHCSLCPFTLPELLHRLYVGAGVLLGFTQKQVFSIGRLQLKCHSVLSNEKRVNVFIDNLQ